MFHFAIKKDGVFYVNQYDSLLNVFDKEQLGCRRWNTEEIKEAFRTVPPVNADGNIRGYSMMSK